MTISIRMLKPINDALIQWLKVAFLASIRFCFCIFETINYRFFAIKRVRCFNTYWMYKIHKFFCSGRSRTNVVYRIQNLSNSRSHVYWLCPHIFRVLYKLEQRIPELKEKKKD